MMPHLASTCAISDTAAPIPSRAVAGCDFIQHMVASAHRIDIANLRAPTRHRAPVAFARQIAMYLSHVACGFTFTEIGRCFERDRKTVAHACRLVEDRRDAPNIDLALDYLEAAIATRFATEAVEG